MNEKLRNNKGFTLIELIVVITVLGILAFIVAPSVVGYVKESKRRVCESNKETIMRAYQYYYALEGTERLEDFLANKVSTYVTNAKCPENGVYSVKDDHIVCSVHDEGKAHNEEGENGDDSGDEGDNGDDGNGDDNNTDNIAFISINGITVYLSGNWGALKQEAANNYTDNGIYLQSGLVLKDETGVYVIKWTDWLSRENGINDISLATYAQQRGDTVQKIDTSKRIFDSSDYDAVEDKWINMPSKGTLYLYNNELYMCYSPSQYSISTDVNAGDWIKLIQ